MTPVSPSGQLRRMVAEHHLAELTEPDVETAAQLLDDSEAHLRGVGASVQVADFCGAQLLAYEVGRKAALALLLASGYRPAGGDEHRKTFEAAKWLSSGRARQALVEAGGMGPVSAEGTGLSCLGLMGRPQRRGRGSGLWE
jgi:hypothetical protein